MKMKKKTTKKVEIEDKDKEEQELNRMRKIKKRVNNNKDKVVETDRDKVVAEDRITEEMMVRWLIKTEVKIRESTVLSMLIEPRQDNSCQKALLINQ